MNEREGNLPTPAVSRAGAHSAAEPTSKGRPDAEAMVVTSGSSNRHVGSVADRVLEDLAAAGVPDARVEGMPHCDWVLIDAGDVIVHVFRPEARAFYNLEKMWAGGGAGNRRGS